MPTIDVADTDIKKEMVAISLEPSKDLKTILAVNIETPILGKEVITLGQSDVNEIKQILSIELEPIKIVKE